MSTIRRRLVQTALAVLPALAIAGAVIAAEPAHAPPAGAAHAPPAGMELLHMVMQPLAGAEYETANRLKDEAMHALLMGGDLASVEPKLKAFAQEHARVSGGDAKAMETHVMEVGAQLVALRNDPAFRQHMAKLHGGH